MCHGLILGDNARRRNFCELYTRNFQDDENFLFKLSWSDEQLPDNYLSQQNPRVYTRMLLVLLSAKPI